MFKSGGILILSILPFLAACGGGSDSAGETAAGQPAIGQFKDSNTSGLRYRGAAGEGITDADGRFRYRPGEPVRFSVGKVELGSAPGRRVITPRDLVASGSTADPAVINRVRFLMMLDADGDPDNGITLSPEVQAAAETWQPVDFTAPDLALELADIMAAAREADGGSHVLPAADTARGHLESTLLCQLAGIYTGTFREQWDNNPADDFVDEGFFTGMLDPNSGFVTASGYSVPGKLGFLATGTTQVGFDGEPEFVSGDTNSNATFRGRFQETDTPTVTGTWDRVPIHALPIADRYRYGGDFFAQRISPAIDDAATERVLALDAGVGVTLAIDAQGRIAGQVIDTTTAQPVDVSGVLNGDGTFAAASDDGVIQLTGQWNAARGGYDITVSGHDAVLRASQCRPG